MPARPMYRSPHKKNNPWSRGYQPTFTKYGATASGGHSGNTPLGKKKKRDRVKTGPAGSPNGVHDDRNPQDCRCGRCMTIG